MVTPVNTAGLQLLLSLDLPIEYFPVVLLFSPSFRSLDEKLRHYDLTMVGVFPPALSYLTAEV